MDSADEDQATDYVPTALLSDSDSTLDASEVRRLDTFLRRADALGGPVGDAKIREAADAISDLLAEGLQSHRLLSLHSDRLLRPHSTSRVPCNSNIQDCRSRR